MTTNTGTRRRRTGHPGLRRWVLPIVAVLLTGLAGGVMLWNLQTRQNTASVIPVAIVNSDKSVTTGSGKDEKTIYAGRELAANLTQPDPGNVTPLSWQLVDKADADKGVLDGTYYAVLTIPADFSKNINSVSGKSPVEAELKLVSNDASSTAVATMASLAVQQAAINLGGQVTNNYVANSLDSFTDIHNNLTSSAKSAQSLADSSSELADSSKELAQSSQQLDSGAEQLAEGTASLATGAQSLAQGADESAEGATEVASGAQQLDTAAGQLETGADDVAAAAGRVSTGATRLTRVNERLSSGATELARVNRGLSTGATRVARLDRGLSVATAAHARGLGVSSRLADAAERRTGSVATEAARLRDDYCARIIPLAPELCERLELLAVNAGVGAGESTVVANRIGTAGDVADDISTAAGAVTEISTVLARGAGGAATASSVLARGAGDAAEASTVLARGASGVATATEDVSEGVGELDTAAGSLATGAASAAEGAESVATGATQTASGATELDVSADQLASGANSLASGADSLASGAKQLASGADSLSSGLDNGAKQVPTYSKDQTTKISTVVTTPVGVKASAEPQATAAASLVPVVLGLALWLGTLMMYLTRAAVPTGSAWAQASAGRRVLLGWLPAVGVGIAQTALLVGLVMFSGIQVHNLLGLALFCGLAALSFAATNQALVALFGGIGRLASLAFAVVEAAALGGLAPIEAAPAAIQTLNGVLPLPQFVNAATQMVVGGVSGDVIGAAVVLVGWLIVALLVAVLATSRKAPRLAAASADPPPPVAVGAPATN
jgi:putative membrane protein